MTRCVHQKTEAKGGLPLSVKNELLSPPTVKGRPAEAEEGEMPDAFLANLDAILTFFVVNIGRQQELIDALASNKPLPKVTGFAKFSPGPVESSLFSAKLASLLSAESALKKPVLNDFRRTVAGFKPLNAKDLQAKYDKSRTPEPREPNGLAESTLLSTIRSHPTLSPILSPTAESKDFGDLKSPKDPKEPRDLAADLGSAWESLFRLNSQLKNRVLSEVEFVTSHKLVKEIGSFHQAFQSALEASRDSLVIVSPPDFLKLDFEPDLRNFQKSLDAIRARNGEFERFAYGRLSELREANTQLRIVQNHITK